MKTKFLDGAFNSGVFTILPVASEVYVGSWFTDTAGLPEADYIARWDGVAWSALGSNGAGAGALDQPVMSIVRDGLALYVGGWFYQVSNDGVPVPNANSIAKWNGVNWSGLGEDGSGHGPVRGWVSAVAVAPTGIYVGGDFPRVVQNGLELAEAKYAARWDGSTWHALHTDLTPPAVWAISPAYPNPVSGPMAYFRIDFTEPVTGVDVTDFALITDGLPNATIANFVAGSNVVYYISVAVGEGVGSVRLDLVDDDSIRDASNNVLGGIGSGNGNYTAGEPTIVAPPTIYLPLVTHNSP
ncbi:MAG TPA: hypothetical protein PK530_13645 [Anaerolineales bacterium]|nr:hypothetical protein [Anaerolineales bacterium]